jgi:hypothetical protein
MDTLKPLICESKWTLMLDLIVFSWLWFHLVYRSPCQQLANVNPGAESM